MTPHSPRNLEEQILISAGTPTSTHILSIATSHILHEQHIDRRLTLEREEASFDIFGSLQDLEHLEGVNNEGLGSSCGMIPGEEGMKGCGSCFVAGLLLC